MWTSNSLFESYVKESSWNYAKQKFRFTNLCYGAGKTPGHCCILASGSARARTTMGSLEATNPVGDGDKTWISFIRIRFRFHLNSNANHCTGRWWKIKGRGCENTHSLLVLMSCHEGQRTLRNQHLNLDMETIRYPQFLELCVATFKRSVVWHTKCVKWYPGNKRKGRVWNFSTLKSVEWQRDTIWVHRKEKGRGTFLFSICGTGRSERSVQRDKDPGGSAEDRNVTWTRR